MEQLASRLGVTRKTVYNWISRGDIPKGKLKEMSEVFDCSADYLLGLTSQQKGATQ
ncbi:MAG: helix-turn-helix transcriptional regulator [Subdoligranulum sp.]|nr:helix-turn-helix transcriptional regulator [Subdoligranulum sp.]